MEVLERISEDLQEGLAEDVVELVKEAIDAGLTAQKILNDGLLAGMNIVGQKFKNMEMYVPDVLMSARAMSMGTDVLKPLLLDEKVEKVGKVVIGTVKGDLHDIGKNLVKMMMEGRGLEVIDLGSDVEPALFIDKAIEEEAAVVACSALLTTTMIQMEDVVGIAKEKGVRESLAIMVGGAPLSQEYCDRIGADCFAADAATAAEMALNICLS